jgi:hypothetical protein
MVDLLVVSAGVLLLEVSRVKWHGRSWWWMLMHGGLLSASAVLFAGNATPVQVMAYVVTFAAFGGSFYLHRERVWHYDSWWFKPLYHPKGWSASRAQKFDGWHVLSFLSAAPIEVMALWQVAPLDSWLNCAVWIALALASKLLWRWLKPREWR